MLSSTSDYALRAALVLARHYGERPVRVDEIAQATGAPRNYLGKTLNALVKAGVVASARGPAGGYMLSVAPTELSLARIIDCFDDPHPSAQCLLGTGACDPTHACAAHRGWTAVVSARRAPLTATTVGDLLAGARPAFLRHVADGASAPSAA